MLCNCPISNSVNPHFRSFNYDEVYSNGDISTIRKHAVFGFTSVWSKIALTFFGLIIAFLLFGVNARADSVNYTLTSDGVNFLGRSSSLVSTSSSVTLGDSGIYYYYEVSNSVDANNFFVKRLDSTSSHYHYNSYAYTYLDGVVSVSSALGSNGYSYSGVVSTKLTSKPCLVILRSSYFDVDFGVRLFSTSSGGSSSFDFSSATITPSTVLSGYTGYGSDGSLITGTYTAPTFDFSGADVLQSKILNGYKAFDSSGTLITGTALSEPTTVSSSSLLNGVTAYDSNGTLVTGSLTVSGNEITSGGSSSTVDLSTIEDYLESIDDNTSDIAYDVSSNDAKIKVTWAYKDNLSPLYTYSQYSLPQWKEMYDDYIDEVSAVSSDGTYDGYLDYESGVFLGITHLIYELSINRLILAYVSAILTVMCVFIGVFVIRNFRKGTMFYGNNRK